MLRSWPLPARRTTSPGRALVKAARIASSRSGTRSRLSPRCLPAASAPDAICPRIASGSSPRGSSSVATTRRQRSPATRPWIARLATSRSPADPKTAISPPVAGRQRSEGVESRRERRRRVGVVDDHRERLAAIDALHAAADARGSAASAGGDGLDVELEELAQGDGGERVVDVEAPDQRQPQVDRPARVSPPRRAGPPPTPRRGGRGRRRRRPTP